MPHASDPYRHVRERPSRSGRSARASIFKAVIAVAALTTIVAGLSVAAAASSVSWGAHGTPAAMSTGASASVNVSFTNDGTTTWAAGGTNPVRLSYHWRSDACPGTASAVWDGRRASLPGDVAPGASVANLPISVLAPGTAGTYCLVYDLVHEGVAWFSSLGAPTLSVTVTVSQPGFGVSWGTHNTPATMGLDADQTVAVSFTNTGSNTWDAGGPNPVRLSYHWRNGACPGTSIAVWDGRRAVLPANVASGGSVAALSLLLRTPAVAGSYCLQYDLVQEGITWFSSQGAATLPVSVNVLDTSLGVTWGSHSTPPTMTPGVATAVNVSFTNSGTSTWQAGGSNPVRLSYHWRNGACPGTTNAIWDGQRASLAANVAPGGSVNNLPIGVVAPATGGTYCLQYDLVKEGVVWFSSVGAPLLAVTVTVGAATPPNTINFDGLNGANLPLNGQYPTGVIDWGANSWLLSGPWGLFTTKSIGFNGAAFTNASFTLITPRRLISLQAFNGGTVSSTLTLTCAGQPNVQAVAPVGQIVTVTTNWTNTCTSVNIASTNGWNTNFDNLVVDGPPLPSPTSTPTPGPTPTPVVPPTAWAFQETFTGAPASPQPFNSPRFDVIVSENNSNAVITGFNFDDPNDNWKIQTGHGTGCEPPPAQRIIVPEGDALDFQVITRPQLMFTCRNHMMTVMKSGYGIISFMPRQQFDWAGRTGTLEIDTNIYAFGREWWDLYITPEDEMLLENATGDEGATGEELPKRGLKFSVLALAPELQLIDNYQAVWSAGMQNYGSVFANDPARTDATQRRTHRIQISATHWTVSVQKQDGSFYMQSGSFPAPLSFTRGVVRVEHHAYNPRKDGIQDPYFTYHWDNFRFDGPVVPASLSFEAPPHFIDMRHASVGTLSQPVTINVTATNSARLIGHLFTEMLHDSPTDTILNSPSWVQVRVNGGPWVDVRFRKPVYTGRLRGWTTIDTPITGLVVGANTVQFRYSARPPGLTWQPSGFRIKDLEIQVAGAHPMAYSGVESFAPALAAADQFRCDVGSPAAAWAYAAPSDGDTQAPRRLGALLAKPELPVGVSVALAKVRLNVGLRLG